ncbi:MAG: GIY-YIG nuclease family protein [Terriglobia bacterium]
MDDQTNDTSLPAGVSKSENPSHGVTAVANSAPNEARDLLAPSEEEKPRENEDDQRPSSDKTPAQLIREIREHLDQLWEAQKESIIATIKKERLDPAYERTRKQKREILDKILTNAEQFWRQTGLLKKWIHDLTREDDDGLLDYRHKFWRGSEAGHEQEKFDDLCRWLEKKGLADRAGCYCFKTDDKYRYIGKADVLRDRIKQHERERYFTYSNAIRIVIPRDKRKLGELERLLILGHDPDENRKSGTLGGTPLDDLLGFLEREVNELNEDAPLRELD